MGQRTEVLRAQSAKKYRPKYLRMDQVKFVELSL